MRGGSSPQKGGQAAQALGRSRGGFSTKIHVSVDGLGNPLRFILTGGQQRDITQAESLIAGYAGEHVLADQGYDAQEFRQHILELGMMPVIPPRANRKEPADYDRHLYRERHLVECFIKRTHMTSRTYQVASGHRLRQAREELAAGDVRQASEKGWGAAAQIVNNDKCHKPRLHTIAYHCLPNPQLLATPPSPPTKQPPPAEADGGCWLPFLSD